MLKDDVITLEELRDETQRVMKLFQGSLGRWLRDVEEAREGLYQTQALVSGEMTVNRLLELEHALARVEGSLFRLGNSVKRFRHVARALAEDLFQAGEEV
jgi:hypothetical protein